MSLNVSGSKYIKVYDPTIRLDYSDKVLWANLVSSRKTGAGKVDGETGEAVVIPIRERKCRKGHFPVGKQGLSAMPLSRPSF